MSVPATGRKADGAATAQRQPDTPSGRPGQRAAGDNDGDADRGAQQGTAVWAAKLGMNLPSSTLKEHESGKSFHVQQAEQIRLYRSSNRS